MNNRRFFDKHGLCRQLVSLLALVTVCQVNPATALAQVGALKSELVISTGLSLPMYAAAPAGDMNSLYIAEGVQARIRRLDLTTKTLSTMLDLPNPTSGQQTGLNGFAFHPDFANNGKIYINLSGNAQGDIRILEYTRSTVDPTIFDPTTEREIITVPNPSFSHNGGWLEFSPTDENLYLLFGDGGNVPPQSTKGLHAQDLSRLEGKLLRIDVDGDDFPEDPERNYAIPETNPFAGGGGRPEIFAYGLRHPFRAGFDRGTGDLFIGDVGSGYWEEINYVPNGVGGQNFGWRPREGFLDNPAFSDPSPPNAVDPIHVTQNIDGAAIIGGYVYRGDAVPWLQGTYFFTDFVTEQFYTFRYEDGQVTELTDRTQELASSLGSYGGVASFGQDAAGNLYLVDYSRGDIYRILARTPREMGDYNSDGLVDAADYTVWRNSLNSTGPGLPADGNGDSTVNQADYNVWKQFYGRSTLSGAGAGSLAVPEPASLVSACFLVLTLGLLRFRPQMGP